MSIKVLITRTVPGNKGRPARHIATAALRGLGTDDPAKRQVVEVEVPPSLQEAEPLEG